MARAIILLIGCTLVSAGRSAPSVVSINLCTDQLVLNVASAEQILSLSWLAADEDESMMAERAGAYPRNYGSAEEVIRFAPDVVVAGLYSNPYTKSLLKRLGFTLVEIEPARSIADIERNLLRVGEAVERHAAALRTVQQMRNRIETLPQTTASSISAVVIRPGGYTIDRDSLARELLGLAGIHDSASDIGLDAWGSLSVETLLRTNPQLLIVSNYKLDTASLANAWLRHPAVVELSRTHSTVRLSASYWACGTPQSLESVDVLGRAAARML
ncbi:MAG TPA: ABC transporter substrate-binding protein [Gammaproteobacteria bacterium]|nr:ABC transporter substrate-binding protein [Gammaproteobacteria bacterium]